MSDAAYQRCIIPACATTSALEDTSFQCPACGSVFGKVYEYEEDMHVSLDGSADVIVNASIPALVSLRGLELDVEPIAWAPVELTSDEGKVSRFPRGMCRFTDASRGGGTGWIEFNQPQ